MHGHASWTAPQPPREAPRPLRGCLVQTLDIPRLGRVVRVVLSGRQDPGFWKDVRDVVGEEVPRRSPHYLVFDVRALDCIVGSAFVGGLVAGAVEMKRIGRLGATRIVASGKTATRLAHVLSLCKLESVLGAVHGDLASALQGTIGES